MKRMTLITTQIKSDNFLFSKNCATLQKKEKNGGMQMGNADCLTRGLRQAGMCIHRQFFEI